MITPENQQVPAVLDQMTTPGMASRVILELIKMLLKRTNTATKHITVSSFSCVSGGALNPSISMLGLFVVTDDGTEKYDLFVDFSKPALLIMRLVPIHRRPFLICIIRSGFISSCQTGAGSWRPNGAPLPA